VYFCQAKPLNTWKAKLRFSKRSAQPPTKRTAGQIEKKTFALCYKSQCLHEIPYGKAPNPILMKFIFSRSMMKRQRKLPWSPETSILQGRVSDTGQSGPGRYPGSDQHPRFGSILGTRKRKGRRSLERPASDSGPAPRRCSAPAEIQESLMSPKELIDI